MIVFELYPLKLIFDHQNYIQCLTTTPMLKLIKKNHLLEIDLNASIKKIGKI